MKKLILVLLLFIPLSLSATQWFVSPTGDDSNDGTASDDGHAWATWGKAFNWEGISAGDTVYFMGGVYYKVLAEGDDDWYYPARSANGTGYNVTRSGTIDDTTKFWAYPGETPILDDDNVIPPNVSHWGIYARDVDYVWFKGLTVRNVWSVNELVECTAWEIRGSNNIIENCNVYNIHGHGFESMYGNNIYFKNCDAYECCDSLWSSPGQQGTGFSANNPSGRSSPVYFYGCRAWKCSDQGFSFGSVSLVSVNRCWSFNNGDLVGGGHGFKLGYTVALETIDPQRIVTNCIAAYNRESGITTNTNVTKVAQALNIYNNTVYKNGWDGWALGGYGIYIYNTASSDALELLQVFKNNISYDNEVGNIYVATNALYTHEYNSWDDPPDVTVTDGDFISVDSAGLAGARTAWGGLPILTFLHIAEGSDLIGAGVNVENYYDGDSLYHNIPPDLGAFAYSAVEPSPPEYPQVTTAITSIASIRVIATGTSIDDGGGEVSAKGICWDTSTNPTTSDNIVPAGSGTDDFSCTLIVPANTTIYVSAYVTNETATTYGAVVQVDTPLTSPVLDDSGNILVDGAGNIIIE